MCPSQSCQWITWKFALQILAASVSPLTVEVSLMFTVQVCAALMHLAHAIDGYLEEFYIHMYGFGFRSVEKTETNGGGSCD